jgi:hypothetical protein
MRSGGVSATGRTEALADLLGMVTKFPYWFPIVTRPAVSCEVVPIRRTAWRPG